MNLDPKLVQHIRGFGQPLGAEAYMFAPQTPEQINEIYELARKSGKSVSFVGSRRSYGSPMMTPDGIVISLESFNAIGPILDSTVQVGGGVTIEQLWRAIAPQGYWPKVVSGTAKVTIAGAVAMNIHGKNAFQMGNIGEQITALDLVCPNGQSSQGVGSMGLLGAITSATIKLQLIKSASLSVLAKVPRTWEEHFSCFHEMEATSDYMVGWVDMQHSSGRGLFHCANYSPYGAKLDSMQMHHGPLVGLLPRSEAWRVIRLLNRPGTIKWINAAKFASARLLNSDKRHLESLAEFNFLLDSIPGWERAYRTGLLQFQAFAPIDKALDIFRQLQTMQSQRKIVSTLGVLKQHKASPQILPYALDGFSLAMDFAHQDGLGQLCSDMADVVIDQGGRLYLAKDSTLTADQYQRSLPPGALAEFRRLKQQHDPDNLLQSIQSRHLGLT